MIIISLWLFTPLLAVGFDDLPDALIGVYSGYLNFSSLKAFACISTQFRDAVGVLHLDREHSRLYIDNEGYRGQVNKAREMPQITTRLNLGDDFRTYMVDAEFRARVDALVAEPVQQIWSDVTTLDLSDSPIKDISLLAGLVNLQKLDLSSTQVQDISPLARLVNLRNLGLSGTQVSEPALIELQNTRPLLRFFS